jgi:hypothetical protein
MAWWWSWALTLPGIVGFWLSGSPDRSRRVVSTGWAVNTAVQVLWFTYGVVTAQYGFLVSSTLFAVVFVRGWRNWRRSGGEHAAGS